MPTVRFQLEELTCAKSEDRGLLDSRSEDEIYIHGAAAAGSAFKVFMVGEPVDSADAPFRHLKIGDGQTVTFPEAEDTSWSVDLPDGAQIELGFTVHEEDAGRQWPAVANLRSALNEAVGKAFDQSVVARRPFLASDLIAASAEVMRSQEKFNVDDLIGEVRESFFVADLMPETFSQTRQFSGGSRVLASDFAYTVSFRVSRDDRDYGVELLSPVLDGLSLPAGASGSLSVRFKNTGRATISAEDVALVGSSELLGWLAADSRRVDIESNLIGLLPSTAKIAPGEELTFDLALQAPSQPGASSFRLRLYVPSLKHFVDHVPVELSLASGSQGNLTTA
jgi:hypothetical protein